jgi:hypothetical protein
MLRRCDFLRDISRRLWFERRAWENPFRYFGVRRHVSSKSSINLPECRCANLISRFMKLMLGRLSEDWQARWGHPVVMVETFVDSQFFGYSGFSVGFFKCFQCRGLRGALSI